MNLRYLQADVREWSDANFGRETPLNSVKNVLGIVEECGELTAEEPEVAIPLMIVTGQLSHAHLKELQGIRGRAEDHQAKAQDAVADIVIYLADFCGSRGWDMQDIVEHVWSRVKSRDWTKNKVHGGDVASHNDLHPDAVEARRWMDANRDLPTRLPGGA